MSDLRDQLEASLRSPCVWPTKCLFVSTPEPPAEPRCCQLKSWNYSKTCKNVTVCNYRVDGKYR